MFSLIYLYSADESNWEYFKKNFYGKEEFVENRPLLKLNIGYDLIDFNGISSKIDFKNTYSINFNYGFIRINDDLEKLPNNFKHSSEFVFLENISSTFKNFKNSSSGSHTDTWGFGFGLQDGFGHKFPNNQKLFLMHSTGFTWTHIDFDVPNPENNELYYPLIPFDDKIKFGMFYSGGLRYSFEDKFGVDFRYRKNLVHRGFEFDEFLYMYLFDNLTQRWIDYFEPDFMDIFGEDYIWIKFIYKNALSFMIYNLRENEYYYPFEGKIPFVFDSFKIGITYII